MLRFQRSSIFRIFVVLIGKGGSLPAPGTPSVPAVSPSGAEDTPLNTVVSGLLFSAPTPCRAIRPVGDVRLERGSLAHRQTAFPRVRLFPLQLPQRCLVSLVEEGNLWAVVTKSSSRWAFYKLSLKIIRIQKL